MKIAIAGGTGFVGSALIEELLLQGHQLYILTRQAITSDSERITYVQWSPNNDDNTLIFNENIDVFINLAGESINQVWTKKSKERILKSRLNTTKTVAKIIANMKTKPDVLIQASAIGFYGTSKDDTFTETSPPLNEDFLASTVAKWEEAAEDVSKLGVRTVFCRFGLILSNTGGALPKIALPYKLFAGGKMGDGDQWASWIHLDDVVKAIVFAINNEQVAGPINFTAPNPVTMNELGRSISKTLKRPHWFPVSAFLLRTILGEMSLLVLKGQKVLPNKLLNDGYSFTYKTIDKALEDIYK